MESSFDLGALLRNHKKQFKTKPSEFVNVNSGVQKRLENNIKDRKKTRSTVFDKLRNLPKCESPVKLSEGDQKYEDRRQQLEKWKQEKLKRKKEEATKKKKPFVTGVVHVPLKFELPPPFKPKPSTSGCITRSQTAKIAKEKAEANTKSNNYNFAPKNASFRPPKILMKSQKNTTIPKKGKKVNNTTFQPILPNKSKDSSNARNRSTGKLTNQTKCHDKKESSGTLTKSNSTRKTTIALIHGENLENSNSRKVDQIAPESPATTSLTLQNEMVIKSATTPENGSTPMNSELRSDKVSKISPCVTTTRGKDNARREMKKKMEEGLLDDDASDIDNVDHFRRQLASEIKRITEMCETWEKINEQTQLPELAQEAILSAVGQARLLVSQKLAQFGALVERCARPDPASALVTPADLHGFWDMVFMQVENVDVRFMKLNKLKDQGWNDAEPTDIPRKLVKPAVKKSTKPTGGPSKIREMIAAARKAKKEQEEQKSPGPVTENDVKKTFDAGFFCVRSPVRSPGINPSTPNQKATMLKAVLSNEANKASASKQSTSFAMLRASMLGKNMEYDGIAPLPQTPLAPINLEATPSRSILKSAKGIERSSSRPYKVVLFDNSDTEIQNMSSEHDSEDAPKEKKGESDNKIINQEVDEYVENLEEDSGKENSGRKSRLTRLRRQSALDEGSPMLTRRMRKNQMQGTPVLDVAVKEPQSLRRSTRKTLHVVENNMAEETQVHRTPKRSGRRRKSEVRN